MAQSSRTHIYLFGWVSFPEQRICRYLHILLQRRSTHSLARKGPAVTRCALWICLPPEKGCFATGPLKATRQPLQRNAGVFSASWSLTRLHENTGPGKRRRGRLHGCSKNTSKVEHRNSHYFVHGVTVNCVLCLCVCVVIHCNTYLAHSTNHMKERPHNSN